MSDLKKKITIVISVDDEVRHEESVNVPAGFEPWLSKKLVLGALADAQQDILTKYDSYMNKK